MSFKNNQIWGINAQNTKFRFSFLLIMCEFFQNDLLLRHGTLIGLMQLINADFFHKPVYQKSILFSRSHPSNQCPILAISHNVGK